MAVYAVVLYRQDDRIDHPGLCYFGFFNPIVLFVIYGGPVSTNILTIIDTILIIRSIFTNKIKFISLMESIIVLVSFIVLVKALIYAHINLAL